jgi:hypothetical protein
MEPIIIPETSDFKPPHAELITQKVEKSSSTVAEAYDLADTIFYP